MADDTAELQAYLDRMKNPATVDRPPLLSRKYTVTDTLAVWRSMSLKLTGAGGHNRSPKPFWDPYRVGTILDWQGPPDKPILVLSACTGTVLEGLNFTGKASQGIHIKHGGGSLGIAIRDCSFEEMAVGIQCGTTSGEATCANITYDNCYWQCTDACVRLMNNQSLEHLFLRPQFAYAPIAVDVRNGGDVKIVGGGSYELGCLLKLGRIASNTAGFDVDGIRLDGQNTRTQWLDFDDTDRAQTIGAISFSNVTQNTNQRISDKHVIRVAPGARVMVRDCSLRGSTHDWAHVYSDNRAGGELIVENTDGLDGQKLDEYVTVKGPRAYWSFSKCGNLFGLTGSLSNFPEGV